MVSFFLCEIGTLSNFFARTLILFTKQRQTYEEIPRAVSNEVQTEHWNVLAFLATGISNSKRWSIHAEYNIPSTGFP